MFAPVCKFLDILTRKICEGAKKIYEGTKKYWYFAVICLIFVTGILCRLETLFIRELWLDEIFLSANFTENDGFLWVFKPLQYCQIAPPLFLLSVKFSTLIFGINDFSLRLVPILAGIASIFVFYKFSKTVLKTKHSIIIANFLFAINTVLMRFASEFKQYGTDVLVFMLVLMWLSNEASLLQNPDFKTVLKYSIVFTILFFVSQPVVFLFFGVILYNIICSIKRAKVCGRSDFLGLFKTVSISFIPLVFVFLYKFSLSADTLAMMQNFWENDLPGFISFKTFKSVLASNYDFFTLGCKYVALLLPFSFTGFFIFLKRGSKISKIFVLSLFGAIFASILHLYPFVARVILFLLPFALVFAALCFDFEIKNEKIKRTAYFILILAVSALLLLFSAKAFCKNRYDLLLGTSGNRENFSILKENFNKENDVLILPNSAISSFKYYSHILGFGPKYIVNKEDALLALGKNEYFWVYIPFNTGEDFEYLDRWIAGLIRQNEVCYDSTFSRWAKLLKLRVKR